MESEEALRSAIEKKLRGLAKKLRGEFAEADQKAKEEVDETSVKVK